jgi:hypothetical protein
MTMNPLKGFSKRRQLKKSRPQAFDRIAKALALA